MSNTASFGALYSPNALTDAFAGVTKQVVGLLRQATARPISMEVAVEMLRIVENKADAPHVTRAATTSLGVVDSGITPATTLVLDKAPDGPSLPEGFHIKPRLVTLDR